MTEFRSRLPLSALAAGLAGLAVVAMVVDRRAGLSGDRELSSVTGTLLDFAAPIEKVLAAPIEFVRDGWDDYVALFSVRDENEMLRERMSKIEEENLQLREALVASGRLERIVEMREQFDVPMLPAELVGVDASPWFRSVLVDRGRDRGVRSGMPVVSEHGLVGLVTAASREAAKTMLVLDRRSAVDGVVQRSRSRGVVRGQGSDFLEFEFVARGAQVAPGDLVLTSGLDGVFPKGIRIGEIIEVSDPGDRLLQTARMRPSVDFGRLEQIFVMLRRGATMEFLYSVDGASGRSGPSS